MAQGLLEGLLQGLMAGKEQKRQSMLDQLRMQHEKQQIDYQKTLVKQQEQEYKLKIVGQQLDQLNKAGLAQPDVQGLLGGVAPPPVPIPQKPDTSLTEPEFYQKDPQQYKAFVQTKEQAQQQFKTPNLSNAEIARKDYLKKHPKADPTEFWEWWGKINKQMSLGDVLEIIRGGEEEVPTKSSGQKKKLRFNSKTGEYE